MPDLRVIFTRKNGSSSASLLLTVLNGGHPFLLTCQQSETIKTIPAPDEPHLVHMLCGCLC
jgi:hypothetical protein